MSAEPPPIPPRHKRIRFIKRLLRPLPRRTNVHRYPVLKWFAEAARKRPYLWTFRVSAMTPAFYVGSLIALQPIIGVQIPLAFLAALIVKANLPTIIGLQLITNVVTGGFVYAVTYKTGDLLIGALDLQVPNIRGGHLATSLAIGGVVCGLLLGLVLDLTYRFLAYEARKHHWRLPQRAKKTAKESASPDDAGGQKPE